jgi:uncharacterized repeat protein (TIGR03803 family)
MQYCILFVLAIAVSCIAHAQNFSVLYNFGSRSGDPSGPVSEGIIAQGRDGNLYSTTPFGGSNGSGAVFKITPAGELKVLYSFDHVISDPWSGLTLGTDGNFYGTTQGGGPTGYGIIFRITPDGSFTQLWGFMDGSDGAVPFAPPIEGLDGNYYGTTCGSYCAGELNATYGTIYKITPSGKLTSLHQFNVPYGGPLAPLVQGASGWQLLWYDTTGRYQQ